MDSDTYTKYLVKPAVMGALVAAGVMAYRPGAMVVMKGRDGVSLAMVAGGATVIAAEACALINDYLFPHIPKISLISAPLHTALNVGAQVGVTAALENYISPGLVGDVGITELVAFAAAAEVGSTYLVDQWLRPMYASTGHSSY